MADDCPEEPVSSQLWHLMKASFPRHQLVGTVKLLGECPWTSLPAEQQHGSLALLKRWHPDYGMDTLITRALLMQVARMLPGMTESEKQVSQLMRKIQKLQAANPDKASGRQVFLKDLIALARKKQEAGDERFSRLSANDISKHWFSRHAVLWAQQSVRNQHAWHQRARIAARGKRHQIAEEVEALQAKLEVLMSRQDQDRGDPGPLSMSSAAFSESDLQVFERCMLDAAFSSPSRVAKARADLLEPPAPWGHQYVRALSQHQVWGYKDPKQAPWANLLCRDRESFEHTGLRVVGSGGEETFWKILYLVKRPIYVALCPMVQVEDEARPALTRLSIAEAEAAWADRRFKMNFAAVSETSELSHVTERQLWCLMDLQHDVGSKTLSTRELPVKFTSLVFGEGDIYDDDMDKGDAKQQATEEEDYEQLLQDLPWLIHLDKQRGFTDAAKGGGQERSARRRRAAALANWANWLTA